MCSLCQKNKKAMKSFDFTAFSGAMEGTRTPGLLIRSIRVFRKGSAVKRKPKNLQACVHRKTAAKTFAEKLKKWLTSSPPACIISLVSNARRG